MFKVAALTVVKDEAAYIVDWINHCFYMGFEDIYIAVNRSTDLTEKILIDFSKLDSRVHVYNTDWLDMFPNKDGINMHLQYYSFCFLLNEARKDKSITHFFPLDADEFWFSKKFDEKINEYLSSLPSFDVISVPWAAQSGDSKAFLMPFENKFYTLKENVKSVFSRNALDNISKYLLHIPEFKLSKLKHFDADGNEVARIDDNTQRIKVKGDSAKSMILHRMLRSETEYLALVTRQRPSSILPIKDNRWGFNEDFNASLKISKSSLQAYFLFLKKARIPFENDILESQSSLCEKSVNILKVNPEIIVKNINIYIQVFKGTLLVKPILDIYVKNSTSVDDTRNLAIKFEKEGDFEKAYVLMKHAIKLRPNGPVIKRKLSEYEQRLGVVC
jgi:hypothetical protein